jgi:digeranylgeranylglycerophospholipid reductase
VAHGKREAGSTEKSNVRDVAIVGAGPAGLVAARALASSGHDVVVLEEHEQIGVPVHCTGLLGVEAFDEMDLPRQAILTTTHAARFIAADGSSVFVDADRVGAAIVDRARFDQALADGSRRAGAELRTGARVRGIRVAADRVVITGDTGTARVEARACVLACGASYRFNRALGLGVPRAFVQSAQLEAPFAGPEHIEVHLGRSVAPGGFAWVVPFTRDGSLFNRVGLMCETDALARFGEFASSIRTRCAVAAPWPEPRLKILPLGPVTRTYGPRLLAVGDAAGLVKPTTGGGIYYSLVSGHLAADVLSEALAADDLGDVRLQGYQDRWRARLGAEIRIGLAFRTLATRLTDRAIDALVELARIDGLIPILKQTADFNFHSRSALALLKHAQFRKILLASIWT